MTVTDKEKPREAGNLRAASNGIDTPKSITPDLDHASSFLESLAPGATWSFQTFDDGATNDPRLIRQFHGTLQRHAGDLAKLNERGAGIFVTINETDGNGRRKTNITRVRALFVDLDGAPVEPVQSGPTPAHIVTATSPGKYHAYWRVSDCPLDACEPALKELIGRYGGDPACSDRNRVLRLPGFWHRKREPFMVRTIDTTPGEYPLTALGIAGPTEEIFSHLLCSSVGVSSGRFLPEATGERNQRLFDLARWLKGQHPESEANDHRQVVVEWHREALPTIGTADLSTTWADFVRGWKAIRHPFGATLNQIMEGIDMNDDDVIPDNLVALGYGTKAWKLVKVCEALQRHEGDKPFFLSARQAGELIDCHFTDAGKMLFTLVTDGVLELVERGAGKKASRYRYVWQGGEADAVRRASETTP